PSLVRDTTAADAAYSNIISHKYFAVDVTFKSSDWTHGTFANTGAAGARDEVGAASVIAYINGGYVGGAGPLIDRTGFDNLGKYIQGTAGTTAFVNRGLEGGRRRAFVGGV